MAKSYQDKPSNESSKSSNPKIIGISKIEIGSIKNGRVTSEAPSKPQKPTKDKT